MRKAVLALLGAALLQGCAVNPLVSWQEPARPAHAEPMLLDAAFARSAAVREAYRKKMDEQVALSTQLSSSLIAAGALGTALVAGKAHRDAVLAVGLLGATAYAQGKWNLDPERLKIYEATVGALNCADRAVRPLDMSVAEHRRLGARLLRLDADLVAAEAAIARTQAELARWQASAVVTAELAQPFVDSIAGARTLVDAARQAQQAGRTLHTRAYNAPGELEQAVGRIHDEARTALTSTVGDPSKIPQVVASLGAFAGALVPGAGLDPILARAASDFQAKNAPAAQSQLGRTPGGTVTQVVTPAALIAAQEQMRSAAARASILAQSIQAQASAAAQGVQASTLGDCGLGELALGPRLNKPRLEVSAAAAQTYRVTIAGGKPPFEVVPEGSMPAGLTVTQPLRLQRVFHVVTTADLAAGRTVHFQVLDSSDPERSAPFTVASAADTAGAGAGPAGGGAAAPDSQSLLSLQTAGQFEVDGVKLTPSATPVLDAARQTLTVKLACSPPALARNARLAQPKVRAAYVDQLKRRGLKADWRETLVFTSDPKACIAP